MQPIFTLTEEEMVREMMREIEIVLRKIGDQHRRWGHQEEVYVCVEGVYRHYEWLAELAKRLSPVSQR